MASLAFVNGADAYVTAGTYCYLPKRPLWYRLALAWIPRYLILLTISVLYAGIYVYVKIKFHNFSAMIIGGSSLQRGEYVDDITNATAATTTRPNSVVGALSSESKLGIVPSGQNTVGSSRSMHSRHPSVTSNLRSSLLIGRKRSRTGSSDCSSRTRFSAHSLLPPKDFVPSAAAAGFSNTDQNVSPATSCKTDTTSSGNATFALAVAEASAVVGHDNSTQPACVARPDSATLALVKARDAISRQLRFLFVYPLVYLLMWTIPFANHCLVYSDAYVEHPSPALTTISTIMLALQGGVDCWLFCWRERPWKAARRQRERLCRRRKREEKRKNRERQKDVEAEAVASIQTRRLSQLLRSKSNNSYRPFTRPSPPPRDSTVGSHWWEEEGRRRRDSVWMGTDRSNSPEDTEERPHHMPILEDEWEEDDGRGGYFGYRKGSAAESSSSGTGPGKKTGEQKRTEE